MKIILYLRNKEKYAYIINLKYFYLVKLTQKNLIDLEFFSLVEKKLPAKAGDLRDTGLIPGLGRSSGIGNDNHSSIHAWRIPWTEEPSGLQSIGTPLK